MAMLQPPQALMPCFVSSPFLKGSSFIDCTRIRTTTISNSTLPSLIQAFAKLHVRSLLVFLVFSAIPFAAVKLIVILGDSLQRRLEANKKFVVENSAMFKALVEKARKDRREDGAAFGACTGVLDLTNTISELGMMSLFLKHHPRLLICLQLKEVNYEDDDKQMRV